MGAQGAEPRLGDASPLAARRWLFAAAILDERSLTLHVAGRAVELERKPLEVLLHLLHHAGEIVTKDELLAAVWPGRVLSDSALTSCMHKLREALGDDAQDVIRTQHGYGYRLVAPVKVEAAADVAAPRFDFKAGDRPPLRPQWALVQRLGAGGHGEAWLARHDKTREARVFKFAADVEALSSLKREITLSRLLHDALGGRPDLVRVLDWNLEEVPYFVESGYSADGSLTDWAAGCGGLAQIPLPTRLEVAAQIAEALAAAHSVGVLHKDLKPSNVLIDAADGPPRVKLSDFGSGGVLDAARLERLGITRMGFTHAAAGASSGGTPLYLAPEVVAGQPFTLQSDIYALGVVLYQLVVGDFARPLAQGWERDVADESLREDIAGAVDGHPEQRLADAARLAQRLRNIDERRQTRAAQRAAEAAAEHARLEMVRVRARRKWVHLTIAAAMTGVVVSLTLLAGALRARDDATGAAQTSRAVTDFLTKDVLAAVSIERTSVKDLRVKDLLDAAGAQIDTRFSAEPQAAAEVHAALAAAYASLDSPAEARAHVREAVALHARTAGVGADPVLDLMQIDMQVHYVLGQLPAEIARYEAQVQAARERLAADDGRLVELRQQLNRGYFWLGDWQRAALGQGAVVDELQARGAPEAERSIAEQRLATFRFATADYRDAERLLRQGLPRLLREAGSKHPRVIYARMVLGASLTELGQVDEAEALLADALAAARELVGDEHGMTLSAREFEARLRLAQGRPADAARLLENVLAAYLRHPTAEVDQSATFRQALATAYQRLGRLPEAETAIRAALGAAEGSFGPAHPDALTARIQLADILRERGRHADALAALATLGAPAGNLPPDHTLIGHWRRVEGLLWLAQGESARAAPALQQAAEIYRRRLGPGHALAREVAIELARAAAGAA